MVSEDECHGGRTPYRNQAGLVCGHGGRTPYRPLHREEMTVNDLEIQLDKPVFLINDTRPLLSLEQTRIPRPGACVNQSRPQPQTS